MRQKEDYIFCCDWGTSSLRLRLIKRKTAEIISKLQTEDGIGRLFSAWSAKAHHDESRYVFLLRVLNQHLQALQQQVDFSIDHIPLVISGMASSSIGIREIPYAELPFSVEGNDISADHIPATSNFPHDIYLISGVKSDDDVIRGEEIEVIGLAALGKLTPKDTVTESVLVLPGTHSKHILIKGKQIVSFKTFMTGEFFSLLTENSIIKDSVNEVDNDTIAQPENREAFARGVHTAVSNGLLHTSFLARTNHLFGKFTKGQNTFFLSGLLIGYELRDLTKKSTERHLIISCGEKLFHQYSYACRELGYSNVTYIPSDILEQATAMGQIAVYDKFSKIK